MSGGTEASAGTDPDGPLTVERVEDPDPADREAVYRGLVAYNRRHGPDPEREELTLLVRDAGDEVVGGLLGEFAWGWLFVKILWLREDLHGRGMGRRLMAMAEDEAAGRRSVGVFLDTVGWQAPGFYAACGYEELGVLEDYPPGFRRHFFFKRLVESG